MDISNIVVGRPIRKKIIIHVELETGKLVYVHKPILTKNVESQNDTVDSTNNDRLSPTSMLSRNKYELKFDEDNELQFHLELL